jgi:hypothetical protein
MRFTALRELDPFLRCPEYAKNGIAGRGSKCASLHARAPHTATPEYAKNGIAGRGMRFTALRELDPFLRCPEYAKNGIAGRGSKFASLHAVSAARGHARICQERHRRQGMDIREI